MRLELEWKAVRTVLWRLAVAASSLYGMAQAALHFRPLAEQVGGLRVAPAPAEDGPEWFLFGGVESSHKPPWLRSVGAWKGRLYIPAALADADWRVPDSAVAARYEPADVLWRDGHPYLEAGAVERSRPDDARLLKICDGIRSIVGPLARAEE